MSTSQISRRYACALNELINESSKIKAGRIQIDLAKVSAVTANDEVDAVLNSPDYAADMKKSIIVKATGGRICAEIDRLVYILVERGKATLLPEINAQVEAMIHQAESQLDAEVTVATAIDKVTKGKLSSALEASTGKQVRLTVSEDQSIIGGMIVRIGDRKIDYSLRTKLAGLRRALVS